MMARSHVSVMARSHLSVMARKRISVMVRCWLFARSVAGVAAIDRARGREREEGGGPSVSVRIADISHHISEIVGMISVIIYA